MTLPSPCPVARRWKAPAQDGRALLDPPPRAIPEVLERNRSLSRVWPERLGNESLLELREAARRDLSRAAWDYTAAYRDVNVPRSPAVDTSFLLAGHQPELVHPGVWFKNFVLDDLARESQGLAINLLIDNDVVRKTSILVPGADGQLDHVGALAFDRRSLEIPYEEREVQDRVQFEGFGNAVARRLRPWIRNPLIRDYWPRALRFADGKLGEALARARHQLEADVGLETLEIPLSHVCRQAGFQRFVGLLLADAPRFHQVYNRCLRDYRQTRKLRSRSHPVPDLDQDDDWLEVPFWVWDADTPVRRRLFVRTRATEIDLSDRRAWQATLRPGSDLAEQLAALEQAGMRLRPRALMTTLYARLILSDLFLHGIGGATYDQLTEMICLDLWEIQLPQLMVVSATQRLPIPRPDVGEADLRRVAWQLRELRYHPERHLAAPEPEAEEWVRQKQHWIQQDPPRGRRYERHLRIEEANQALQPYLQSVREKLLGEQQHLADALRRRQRLGSREFSFCLFPQETLLAELLELRRGAP